MPSQTETVNVRPANKEDLAFLRLMAYEAAFPDWLQNRPTFEDAQKIEWLSPYTDGFGEREGDHGFIAEDADGKPIGAAWYRDYSENRAAEGTPPHELSIALTNQARGRKVGSALMARLRKDASEHGIEELSLIVRETNTAKDWYRKIGFTAVGEPQDGYVTMVGPTSTTAR